jgi:hypothetical protein
VGEGVVTYFDYLDLYSDPESIVLLTPAQILGAIEWGLTPAMFKALAMANPALTFGDVYGTKETERAA